MGHGTGGSVGRRADGLVVQGWPVGLALSWLAGRSVGWQSGRSMACRAGGLAPPGWQAVELAGMAVGLSGRRPGGLAG